MIRTQIQLTEDQATALRKLAGRQHVSVAELIRRAVDQMIEEDQMEHRRRRALAVIGGFKGGPSDVSTNHDKYLAEDYL